MAQLQLPTTATSKQRKYNYTIVPKVDMTPMVDLGFLLITFFIFTTTLADNKATQLFMPADGPSSTLGESNALTLLLDADKLWVYEGAWNDAVAHHKIASANYSVYTGIGSVIRAKQKLLQAHRKNKDVLMLVIKPLATSSYKNVIDALDEVLMNNVKKYAIAEPSKEETIYAAAQ